MASCWPDASVNVYVIVDAVLLLLCRIWPPTVLNWPLKVTPFVRWTTIGTVRAVTGAVWASLTSSSSNHGPLATTTGVTVGPPVAVGVGVGVAVGVGVGVAVGVGVGGRVGVGGGGAVPVGGGGAVGGGVGVRVGVGVGVAVPVGVGVGPPNLATWFLYPIPKLVGVPSYAVIRLGPLLQAKSAFHAP